MSSHATPNHDPILLWSFASVKTNLCSFILKVSGRTHLGRKYMCPCDTPNHMSSENSFRNGLGILFADLIMSNISLNHSIKAISLISLLLGSPETLQGSYLSAINCPSVIYIIFLPLGGCQFHISKVIDTYPNKKLVLLL